MKRWAKQKAQEQQQAEHLLSVQTIRTLKLEDCKQLGKENTIRAFAVESQNYVDGLFAGEKKTQQDAWRLGVLHDKVMKEDEPAKIQNLIVNMFQAGGLAERMAKLVNQPQDGGLSDTVETQVIEKQEE